MNDSQKGPSPSDLRRTELASLRIHRSESSPANERRSSGLGTFLWLLVVAAAAAAGWFAARGLPAGPLEVEILRVAGAAAVEPVGALTATGYLQAVRRTSVGFKSSGRVVERLADEGDRVKEGQVLARLDSQEQAAELARQEAALANARATLAELEAGFRSEEVGKARAALDLAQAAEVKARLELARVKELFSKKAAFRSQLEEAESMARQARASVETARRQLEMMEAGARPEQLDAARAMVRQNEALLELARTRLEETVLKAPFAGTILSKHAEVGAMLMFGGPPGASNNSVEVFTLADLSELEAEVDIAESRLGQVREGQSCEVVADAAPEKKYAGRLSKILPRANRQKAIVPVKVRIEKPDGLLRPDLSVKVSFLEEKREEPEGPRAMEIPLAAVQDRGGAQSVLLVRDGKTLRRAVKLGRVSGAQVEVLEGLSPGETIVARPGPQMEEGVEVAAASR